MNAPALLLLSFPGLLLCDPCSTAGWRAELAPSGEPGTRMVVTGRVFSSDGRTPLPGVIVYAYQTDAKGEYGGPPPRLRGWMRTDAQGRYQFESVRPGNYPNTRMAAHVHFQLWGGEVPHQYTSDLLFDDDAHVRPQDREQSRAAGQFSFVKTGVVRGGALHITFDILAKPAGDRMEDSILHGFRACRLQ